MTASTYRDVPAGAFLEACKSEGQGEEDQGREGLERLPVGDGLLDCIYLPVPIDSNESERGTRRNTMLQKYIHLAG